MGQFHRISVIGAGAWGTVIAQLLAKADREITLWCYEKEVAAAINNHRRNRLRLPKTQLSEKIIATTDLAALEQSDLIFAVTPARHLEGILTRLPRGLGAPIVLCSKGLATDGDLLHQRLEKILPKAVPAVLGGPTLAEELAADLPAAAVVAAADESLSLAIANLFAIGSLRLYAGSDIIGVAIGGVVKNIIAIAAGAAKGYGLGESAAASLIARGYAEMRRLSITLGAEPRTVAGLAGLGDLCLTATSTRSRNFQLGIRLGRGEKPLQGETVEGAWSAPIMVKKARELGIEMPISEAVAALLAEETTIAESVTSLLSRPLKNES